MYKIIGADGKEYGPVTSDQVRVWIAQGRANAATRAAAEGMTEWKALSAFPEFSLLFTTAPSPAAPAILASAPMRGTNGFAVTGMILGIISIMAACCCYGLPFNIVGLIFSIIGLVQIRSHPDRYEGLGMAIAGLVLCILSLVLGVFWLVAGFASGWSEMMNQR